MCVQVSTGTGIMSHFVNLHIVVPEAFILGSGEHHVDVGSGISLVCIIEKPMEGGLKFICRAHSCSVADVFMSTPVKGYHNIFPWDILLTCKFYPILSLDNQCFPTFVSHSPTPPQYVFWYHNDRMINYDTSRGGITVETEPGPKTQSRLTIRDAHDTDSGNYTCSASNTEPASIFVFVSEGKHRLRQGDEALNI
uniref:Ig-like domain-containing protein n=1 Tax=Timema douglasi TaxID=61478 RepID=A0A7R8Z6T7_TIMDO|nr:unnamed protein product [Timema douglasi]